MHFLVVYVHHMQHAPEFEGRQVVTFHNQRDFIFFRHHRYVFDRDEERHHKSEVVRAAKDKAKIKTLVKKGYDESVAKSSTSQPELPGCIGAIRTKLQELGPRFTLKLKWVQLGSFDTVHGEYEWLHERGEMDTDRKKFNI